MTAGAELERMRPSDGARFLFERERDDRGDGAAARYRAWVLTPSAIHAYTADLADDGGVRMAAEGDPAPAELAAMLETIAKLTARAAAGKREHGLPPWPHRVLRWRGAGRGGSSSSSDQPVKKTDLGHDE